MSTDPNAAGPADSRDLPRVHRFSHEAMATVFGIQCQHADARYAAQAAHAAFDLVDRLERQLSRFVPNSDIGRINSLAAGGETQVNQSTMECLVVAQHLFQLTGGRFDIALGTGLPSLELRTNDCVVRATVDGIRLDLGGIGKGFTVDLVADLLAEWGIERALLHGGFSSVLALSPPAGADGWPLTLTDPADAERRLASLSRTHTALGASGLRKGGHIVNPATGLPVSGRRAAWVAVPRPTPAGGAWHDPDSTNDGPVARPTTVADALTTAFMLMPLGDIRAVCAANPGVEAWILDDLGILSRPHA